MDHNYDHATATCMTHQLYVGASMPVVYGIPPGSLQVVSSILLLRLGAIGRGCSSQLPVVRPVLHRKRLPTLRDLSQSGRSD